MLERSHAKTKAVSLSPNLTFLGFNLATKRPQAQGSESTHNWFLCANWWHGDTPLAKGLKLQPIFAGYWVSQIGARGYADGDNSIHLRYSIFHQLRTGEISSVESSVMFRVKGRTVLSFLDILDKGIEQRIMLSFLNRLGKNNFSN
jgi:hypothetical protein